jgi:hypothetical protein
LLTSIRRPLVIALSYTAVYVIVESGRARAAELAQIAAFAGLAGSPRR